MLEANCTEGSYDEWHSVWAIVKIASLSLSVAPFYLFLSMAVHHFHKMKESDQTPAIDRKYSIGIDAMCCLAALLTFFRVGVDFELILGRETDSACIVSMRAKNVLYLLALGAMYAILWLRQRVFYGSPALRHLRATPVRMCGWFTLFLLVCGILTMIGQFLVLVSYEATTCGCRRFSVSMEGTFNVEVAIYIGGLVGSVTCQVVMLVLFLYPLVMHRISRDSGNSSSRTRGGAVMKLMKRACIATAVCIVTDILSFLAAMTFGKYEAYKMTYEINLVLNLCSIIFSFPDWRNRFLPCRHQKERRPEEESGASGGSALHTQETTAM